VRSAVDKAVKDYVRELRIARNLQAIALDARLCFPGYAKRLAYLPGLRAAAPLRSNFRRGRSYEQH
jgi:hypothetical protein